MFGADSSISPRSFFKNDRVLLFILSFLSLFIEIMLIRHLSSEIRIFAYFKNLVLIGAFLGLGLGYLYRPKLSMTVTVACIALLAALTNPVTGFFRISDYLNMGGFNIWTMPEYDWTLLVKGLFMVTVIFFIIIVSQVPVGQRLGEIFDRSQNRIVDYSINIAGSLAGVWFFAWLSFKMLPPIVWYFLALGLIFSIWRWNMRKSALIAVLGVIMAVSLSSKPNLPEAEIKWSPYQKISFKKERFNYISNNEKGSIDYFSLFTNSTLYMYLLNLSDSLREEHPSIFDKASNRYYYYDIPYNFPRKLDDVLILGAGGGNDVAAALRAGAARVTAVEIDPVILSYGKKYHPEKPYSSDRVTLVNNDGRNFLRKTDKKFDLIVLGLLDSHTLTSSFSNTNLDSYMYTLQSVGDMKKHLKEDGVLALSFQIVYSWIGGKIHRIMETQFGQAPVLIKYVSDRSVNVFIRGTGGTYFITSPDKNLIEDRIKNNSVINGIVVKPQDYMNNLRPDKATIQTDDWPYLYVEKKAIPLLHIVISLALIGIFLLVYLLFLGKPGKNDWHFAALGAGFLLLQVSVISRFALFWGATWLVSSIVISLILIAILIANGIFLSIRRHIPYPLLYGLLAAMLIVLYFTPLESNLNILFYLAPFTVIGLLFAQSFSSAKIGSKALAFNLFGALVGGLSESLSFVSGLSSLIVLALGFYIISGLLLLKRA